MLTIGGQRSQKGGQPLTQNDLFERTLEAAGPGYTPVNIPHPAVANMPKLSNAEQLAQQLGITNELAQQIISNRQSTAAATPAPLTKSDAFEKVLEAAGPNPPAPVAPKLRQPNTSSNVVLDAPAPVEAGENLAALPTSQTDINNLVERLANAAVSQNARTELTAIVNTYVPGIDIEGIMQTKAQLQSLFGNVTSPNMRAAILAGNLYNVTQTSTGTNTNMAQLTNAMSNFQTQKVALANLNRRLTGAQYHFNNVSNQIYEYMGRVQKLKRSLETAPERDVPGLTNSLAKHVEIIHGYQPSWYLLDNLLRTMKHQKYLSLAAAGLPNSEYAQYADSPEESVQQVLQQLNGSMGTEYMQQLAQGISSMTGVPHMVSNVVSTDSDAGLSAYPGEFYQ